MLPTDEAEIARDSNERELAAARMRAIEEAEAANFDPTIAAQREMASRELARRFYLPFVLRFNPDYMAGWAHKDICRRLEKFSDDVAAKKSPRLMLFMPPRAGKSLLTTKTLPAWHLGRYPKHEAIICSYSGALSMTFSRSVRSILRDPAYAGVFPSTKLDPESQSAEAWLTTDGGGLTSAGVGGAITGKGAHILIIDDPIKNREEADSSLARQSIYDWYTSTAYTRLAPGAGVLVILTRWHDEDLAGMLINAEKEGGDKWEIVCYPAIAKQDEAYRLKGEALHPERYDEVALERIRKAIGPRDWAALYQQDPVPDTGAYFTRDMIEYYRKQDLPHDDVMHNYTAWDLAVATKDQNDWTVGITASMDDRDKMYVRDRVRVKEDASAIVGHICDHFVAWKSAITGIERGQIELAIGPFLEKEIGLRKLYSLYIEPLKPGKRDKLLRARSIQGLMRQKRVLFPHPDEAPWVAELVEELLRFPNGKHDDQVDALAWLGLMIEDMNGITPPPPVKPVSWRDKVQSYMSGASGHNSAMSA